jgi:hypothetical protein
MDRLFGATSRFTPIVRAFARGEYPTDGDVPPGDKTYLAQLVSARTGLSQADAEKRVNDVIAKAKAAEMKARQIADAARKAGAYLSIFTAVSMLIGAFIAAAATALGGRHRDEDWRTHIGSFGHR